LNPFKFFGILDRSGKKKRSGKLGKDKFLLVRPMVDHEEGLVPRPSGGKVVGRVVGGVGVSIGREDGAGGVKGEVRTSGWVIVRFIPRATGLRLVYSLLGSDSRTVADRRCLAVDGYSPLTGLSRSSCSLLSLSV
jgi:hypothetical protein